MANENQSGFNKASESNFKDRIYALRDEKIAEVEAEDTSADRKELEKKVLGFAAEVVYDPYDNEAYEKWREAEFKSEGLPNDPRPTISPKYG